MKFLIWVKKHIVLSFSIVALLAAAITAGASFGSSRGEYNDYLVKYNENQEALKNKIAQLPKSVVMTNDYVTYGNDVITSTESKYKNNYLYFARHAVVAPLSESNAQEYKKLVATDDSKLNEYITSLDRSGGAITFKINAEEAGLSDVVVEMRTNWKNSEGQFIQYDNLSDEIKIQFNKLEIKTSEMVLPADRENFSSFVLKDVLLLKGVNTLTITTSAYNPYKTDSNKILYVMPDIRNVAVMTDVNVTVPELTA